MKPEEAKALLEAAERAEEEGARPAVGLLEPEGGVGGVAPVLEVEDDGQAEVGPGELVHGVPGQVVGGVPPREAPHPVGLGPVGAARASGVPPGAGLAEGLVALGEFFPGEGHHPHEAFWGEVGHPFGPPCFLAILAKLLSDLLLPRHPRPLGQEGAKAPPGPGPDPPEGLPGPEGGLELLPEVQLPYLFGKAEAEAEGHALLDRGPFLDPA